MALFVSGCATAQQKRMVVASQAAYAINDSLKAGRVDLAKKYSEQLVRLAPPPKKRIEVKPIEITRPTTDGQSEKVTLTILPPEYQNRETLITGSKEFTKIVEEHPDIAAQLKKEDKTLDSFTKTTDSTLRAVEAELDKEKKKSFWGWLWAAVSGFGIIGIVILCVVFPAAIPIVINVFTSIIGGINRGISALGGMFKKTPPG